METQKSISAPRNTIYQCAPVNALVEGLFEEKVGFSEIKEHGDFGLGTFDKLDGEMVMLDGIIYQIDGEGRVRIIDANKSSTPFACVTFFRPLCSENISSRISYEDLLQWLHQQMPSPNMFYAFRIDGMFNKVRVRSVSKQDSLRPLVEVAKEQSEFRFSDIKGTVAGFFTPSFMASINVPGLHLHFISADRSAGGHLLNCEPEEVRVQVQFIQGLELSMPMTIDYLTCDFTRDIEKDLDKAEK